MDLEEKVEILDAVVSSVEECIRIYGLGVDCEYEILEVKEISK